MTLTDIDGCTDTEGCTDVVGHGAGCVVEGTVSADVTLTLVVTDGVSVIDGTTSSVGAGVTIGSSGFVPGVPIVGIGDGTGFCDPGLA